MFCSLTDDVSSLASVFSRPDVSATVEEDASDSDLDSSATGVSGAAVLSDSLELSVCRSPVTSEDAVVAFCPLSDNVTSLSLIFSESDVSVTVSFTASAPLLIEASAETLLPPE